MVEHPTFTEAMIEAGQLVTADENAMFGVVYDMNEKTWSVFKIGDPVLGIRQSMPLRYRQYLVVDAFMYATLGRALGETQELEN